MNDKKIKPSETNQRPIIQVIEAPKSTGSRKLIIALVVVLCLAVTGYALTIDSFADYNPPDYLSFNWYDYTKSASDTTATVNNAVSPFPRWSVEYPYRAIFLRGNLESESPKKHKLSAIIVYCKEPVTNLLTFEYNSSPKTVSGTRYGYIRAKFLKASYDQTMYDPEKGTVPVSKIKVVAIGGTDTPVESLNLGLISSADGFDGQYFNDGSHYYFDFDFFYDCSDEHQQNAQALNINGLTSISGVPYNYIIHCKDHIGYTGGGGGESSGGSGSGTGSNGGKKWGNGQYGGGIDFGAGGAPKNKEYETKYNANDLEYSESDDWRDYASSDKEDSNKVYSWENDSNIPKPNFKIPIPDFNGQGDGDTGYSGGTLPDFSDIPTGGIDFNFSIPTMPNKDKITFIGIPPELYFSNGWPPRYPY